MAGASWTSAKDKGQTALKWPKSSGNTWNAMKKKNRYSFGSRPHYILSEVHTSIRTFRSLMFSVISEGALAKPFPSKLKRLRKAQDHLWNFGGIAKPTDACQKTSLFLQFSFRAMSLHKNLSICQLLMAIRTLGWRANSTQPRPGENVTMILGCFPIHSWAVEL